MTDSRRARPSDEPLSLGRVDAPDVVERGLWDAIIEAVLGRKLVVSLVLGLLAVAGIYVAPFAWDLGFERDPIPVDAIPDIGENQQIVWAEWEGRSATDVEDQLTYPLSTALLGIPGVRTVRTFSMFSAAWLYVIFDEGVEFYWSRARIIEKLASLPSGLLPAGVTPRLGPDATALGQVYWYTLQGLSPEGEPVGGWDLHELRTIQDFQVRYALAAVDGVAEVASIGGYAREVHVQVDPQRLRAFDVSLDDVFRAVRDSNEELGARTTEMNGVEYVIRGIGFVDGEDDISSAVIRTVDGAPLRVADVAHVTTGPGIRVGAMTVGGAEAVGGVIVARYGANPLQVIRNVERAVVELSTALPARELADGTISQVTVVPIYDRSALIQRTLGTLESALYQQMLITILVVLVMMLHIRSSFLITSLLPVSVLFTFVAMRMFGVDANVVALAGIAIAIGTMVDIGIVMTENIVVRVEEDAGDGSVDVRVRRGASEVAGAVVTAVSTTIVSFLPVFLLEGPEGKLFGPLAFTKTFALVASLVVAIFGIPVLASLMMTRRTRRAWIHWAARVLQVVMIVGVGGLLASSWAPLGFGRTFAANALFVLIIVGGLLAVLRGFVMIYDHLLEWVLAHKMLFALFPMIALIFGATVWLGYARVLGWMPEGFHRSALGQRLHVAFSGMQTEFMPQLDEGAFLYMPSTMPHASFGEALDIVRQLDLLMEAVPEVRYAAGKLGRAETALDPAPVSMIETLIEIEPEYVIDANGRVMRFAQTEDGTFRRDSEDALIPDPRGSPYRNWRPEIESADDIWNEIVGNASLVPGVTTAPLLQPISTRIVMLQSGIRAPMAVRVRGPNIHAIVEASGQIEALLREVPGVNAAAVNADRPVGKPYFEVVPRRDQLARYGISMAMFQQTMSMAVGGRVATTTVEGRERYPVRVGYPRELRDTPERILTEVLLHTDAGVAIPLGEVATIRYASGAQMLRGEDTYPVNYVMFDRVDGFGELEVVDAVRAAMERAIASGEMTLPEGVSFSFAGSYENVVRARDRLTLLLPVVLAIIFVLLYLQFRSVWTSLFVFCGIAVAMSGGFILLWLYGVSGFLETEIGGVNLREVFRIHNVDLSVAVAVGFIALFGIATDDGVVMATYLDQQFEATRPQTRAGVRELVRRAGRRRVRPCLMTTATTTLALLPVLTSSGTGADVMVPMAVPLVGGMLLALMTLFVVPVLYALREEIRVSLRPRSL